MSEVTALWRYPDLDFVMNGYGDIFTDAEIARLYSGTPSPCEAPPA